MTTRREALFGLGLGTLSAAIPTLAQQPPKAWRVGWLAGVSRPASFEQTIYGGFLERMRELGYVEGKNLVMEWRFAGGKLERFPEFVAELVQLKADIIVVASTLAALAAKKGAGAIPIVMANVNDPVASGLVASLSQPGGNITGLSLVATELVVKHLEMMMAMVPRLSRVALLQNPAHPLSAPILKLGQTAAGKLGITVFSVAAPTAEEIEEGFEMMKRQRAEAVLVVSDPFYSNQRKQIADLCSRYRLPAIGSYRQDAQAGILMSYGQDMADVNRRAATFVDKIIKGAKPSALPVEQPTKFDLVINGKTAKALGLTIPQELVLRADVVIE